MSENVNKIKKLVDEMLASEHELEVDLLFTKADILVDKLTAEELRSKEFKECLLYWSNLLEDQKKLSFKKLIERMTK